MKIIILLALSALALVGCQSVSPEKQNEQNIHQARRSRPVEEWGNVYDDLLRKGTISPERHKSLMASWEEGNRRVEAVKKLNAAREQTARTEEATRQKTERAAAEQRARDWAALTPQQRMEWELRRREMLARGRAELMQYREVQAVEKMARDADWAQWQRSWDDRNARLEQRRQTEDTTRALDDIANELRWKR